jgi:hypothetical protein
MVLKTQLGCAIGGVHINMSTHKWQQQRGIIFYFLPQKLQLKGFKCREGSISYSKAFIKGRYYKDADVNR